MAFSSYLLLLPQPSMWPVTQTSLQASFRRPLTNVLDQLASEYSQSSSGAQLDIAVAVPYLREHVTAPRRALYADVQKLVAGLYKLLCIIAAKQHINVEDAEGIDVRILLVTWKAHGASHGRSHVRQDNVAIGPMIDLQLLAASRQDYSGIMALDSEPGQELLKDFIAAQGKTPRVQMIKCEDSHEDKSDTAAIPGPSELNEPARRHNSVIVAGTWDHLHIGHKLLLTMSAFALDPPTTHLEKKVLNIAVTGDELLKQKKYAEILQSWTQRQEVVAKFTRAIVDFGNPPSLVLPSEELHNEGPNGHVVKVDLRSNFELRYTEISDPFGPTITDETITALIISAETRAGGKAVNDKRMDKNWPALDLLEVDVLDADDRTDDIPSDKAFESKLSSTSIRKGLVERGRARSSGSL